MRSADVLDKTIGITIPEPDDFEFWRDRARTLVQAGIEPARVVWNDHERPGDLFASGTFAEMELRADREVTVKASKRFMTLAGMAILHTDPQRHALLYRLLWRLQSTPRLLEDKTDTDVRRLEELDKNVRRDIHKMHAFVRFRRMDDESHGEAGHYVAWFEPEHHIVRATAGFFVRRFTNMRWSILTPRGCLHWDGMTLRESPPAHRGDAPTDDPVEDLWREYYGSIFNPARLKVGAMLSEMPRKYWKNLPEATLIPDLIAGAQKREQQMISVGEGTFDTRPDDLSTLKTMISACRNCSIGLLDNHAVAGEGTPTREDFSGLMIIGEQPGDQEDRSGRPFVGPAGQLLDMHLQRAGIERERTYVTNAVKHFKFVSRGKRRIHQSPTAKEIDTCRWWLESERQLVQPKLVLALGASSARAILGKTVSVTKVRGEPIALDDGSELWISVHPSYLLRLDGEAAEQQAELFARDLVKVADRLGELHG